MPRTLLWLAVLSLLTGLGVQAEPLSIANERAVVHIHPNGSIDWQACHSTCQSPRWQRLLEAQSLGPLERDGAWVQTSATHVVYRSGRDNSIVREYQLQAFVLTITGSFEPSPTLRAATAMRPLAHEGFAGLGDELRRWSLFDGDVEVADNGDTTRLSESWSGVRNRFWTIAGKAEADQLQLYGGPIDPDRLHQIDPDLDALFLNSMWPGARQLSLGMKWILDLAYRLTSSWGWAILLMSLMVKVLIWPLSRLAQRLQDQVNETKSWLQPMVAKIRAESRGEEQVDRLNALYREHGVSPLYTLKSLTGLLIQIPVFIAAYHLLHEHPGLNGTSFLWIPDLALPDHALSLPFTLPFFGGWLNALPLLMTALTIVTARLHQDAHLSPDLAKTQAHQLYLMALAFLLLFYTFPSGMVLYWTTNNAVEAAKSLWAFVRR